MAWINECTGLFASENVEVTTVRNGKVFVGVGTKGDLNERLTRRVVSEAKG